MHTELKTRRRVLLVTYRRYLEAERALTVARQEMKAWFPAASRPLDTAIGQPGSRIRGIYDRRERAMLQLATAKAKLEQARRRLAAKRPAPLQLVWIR
ncbi:hypothetical protein [Roseovarius indicus]|uniref:Uncharacterized protein n=1 Tax=Roseovarius indicus TaxID=540747 RepID=A0A0T5P5A4_9RHOB|nr:hypothetical protein [Roseovarius indicus]KRS16363.1 hypothetical protein XM52_18695 [Roseovarius indicus]QEW28471.1 hypothetical protein RIdsm_04302 [Roseovarius indicus]SFE10216.1 hypothetical protein SAMN04488031_10584 [Roseovarius indicus]